MQGDSGAGSAARRRRIVAAAACLWWTVSTAFAVGFDPLTDLQTGISSPTCFDSTKTVTGNDVVIDLNGPTTGVNAILGITFDPASEPGGEMRLYLAYADDNISPFTGKIARSARRLRGCRGARAGCGCQTTTMRMWIHESDEQVCFASAADRPARLRRHF